MTRMWPMKSWARASSLAKLALSALVLLLASAVHAQALLPSVPAQLNPAELPVGYVTQTEGAVRWTYPLAAEDEVRSLRALQPKTWRRIVGEFGVAVAPALDIRVARNPKQMRALVPANTPLPGYADGIAFPETGLVLLTLTEPETFLRPDLQTVLTHELSHVALYRAVGGVALPRWFSEGVAVQQAQESSFGRVKTLWEGTLRRNLLSLDALSEHFPARRGEVDLAYAESADFVGFLLSGGGERARFRSLLQQLSQRHAFPEAIEAAYHVPLGYMEREWRAELTQRFGRWPMLFMGLTFLWVLGALLLVIGYLRTRARDRATLQRWAIEEQPVLAVVGPVSAQPVAPTGAVQSSVDDFFDNRHAKHDPGIPTIVHDGQSHTLH
jgi:Peptidase MA superfamily